MTEAPANAEQAAGSKRRAGPLQTVTNDEKSTKRKHEYIYSTLKQQKPVYIIGKSNKWSYLASN